MKTAPDYATDTGFRCGTCDSPLEQESGRLVCPNWAAELAAKQEAERERQKALAHRMEWKTDYQYAVVWRFQETPTHNDRPAARQDFPEHLLKPPAGSGWELNVDRGDQGQWAEPPSWAREDERVIMQAVYWRREAPGMYPSHPKVKIHEQRQ